MRTLFDCGCLTLWTEILDKDAAGGKWQRFDLAGGGRLGWGFGYHFCEMRLRGYDVGGLSESGSQTYIIGMR